MTATGYLVLFALIWVAGFIWSLHVSRLQGQVKRAERARVRQQRQAETKACENAALLTYVREGVSVSEAMLRLGLVPATPEELAKAHGDYQVALARQLAQSPHVTQVQGVTIFPVFYHGGSA